MGEEVVVEVEDEVELVVVEVVELNEEMGIVVVAEMTVGMGIVVVIVMESVRVRDSTDWVKMGTGTRVVVVMFTMDVVMLEGKGVEEEDDVVVREVEEEPSLGLEVVAP